LDRPDNYQEVLAKCYVAMAEVDYDLKKWREETGREEK